MSYKCKTSRRPTRATRRRSIMLQSGLALEALVVALMAQGKGKFTLLHEKRVHILM